MKTITAEEVLNDFEGFLAALNHDHQSVVVDGGARQVVMMSAWQWEILQNQLRSYSQPR